MQTAHCTVASHRVSRISENFCTSSVDAPSTGALTREQRSVVLQTFTVGAELAIVKSSNPGVLSTSWILFVRFIIMPAVSLLFVWATAGRGLYVDDKLVW